MLVVQAHACMYGHELVQEGLYVHLHWPPMRMKWSELQSGFVWVYCCAAHTPDIYTE